MMEPGCFYDYLAVPQTLQSRLWGRTIPPRREAKPACSHRNSGTKMETISKDLLKVTSDSWKGDKNYLQDRSSVSVSMSKKVIKYLEIYPKLLV